MTRNDHIASAITFARAAETARTFAERYPQADIYAALAEQSQRISDRHMEDANRK